MQVVGLLEAEEGARGPAPRYTYLFLNIENPEHEPPPPHINTGTTEAIQNGKSQLINR